MILFKELYNDEIQGFWDFLNILDTETKYMMYESGEREKNTDVFNLKDDIERNVFNGEDFLQIAIVDNKIVGYIRAERGRFNRNSHMAYIVVGILKNHTGKGIGRKFFENLDKWARDNNIIRLELTVECINTIAVDLYKKSGFKIEGIRRKSMFVDKNFVDEYYMAKIL